MISTVVYRTFCIVFLFCCLTGQLFSQGGSNYSIFGFGDRIYAMGAGYESMGGTQIATPLTTGINLQNPAVWSYADKTRLQAGFRFNQIATESATISSSQNNGKMDGIGVLFNVDTAMGISIALGFTPFSTVNFAIQTPVTITLEGDSKLGAITSTSGRGGLSEVFAGVSYKVAEGVRAGASLLGLFGTINTSISTQIYTSNSLSSEVNRRDEFSGGGIRAGIVMTPAKNLTIGAAGSWYSSLDISTTQRSVSIGSILIGDTTVNTQLSTSMPWTFGFGTSYKTGKFLIAADALFTDYSELSYREGKSVYSGGQRFTFGISRLGTFAPGTSFGDRINFNFGGGYETLPFKVNNSSVSDMFLSIGAEIPITTDALMGLSVTGGQRGSVSDGLVKEMFARFNVTFTINEMWFQPFARE